MFFFIRGKVGMGGNCCPSIPENPTENKKYFSEKNQK